MAGNANSGRTSAMEELTRYHVLRRSWALVNAYLMDESIPESERVKIAIQLSTKNVPQEIEQRTIHDMSEIDTEKLKKLVQRLKKE